MVGTPPHVGRKESGRSSDRLRCMIRQCKVGWYYNGTLYQTLVDRWNGTSWALVPSANTSVTKSNYPFGVACTSASNCWG